VESGRLSAARVVEVEQMLAESKVQAYAMAQSLAEQGSQLEDLEQRLDRADRVMTAMKASLSWRITAPLRALKRRR